MSEHPAAQKAPRGTPPGFSPADATTRLRLKQPPPGNFDPAVLAGTPAGRRLLSEINPTVFDRLYCGMRYAAHRDRWLAAIEHARSLVADSTNRAFALLLGPRKHGKTEATISIIARTLCLNRDARCLIVGENKEQAVKRAQRVKALLLSERVAQDWTHEPDLGFGPFRAATADRRSPDRWGASVTYVERPTPSVDPSLEAVGRGGALTGGHFDLIILDDVEADIRALSEGERRKTREWFRGTVRPMVQPGGLMLVIGTRKHHDDLYAHLLLDPTFSAIVDRAIVKMPDTYEYLYRADEHGREVLDGINYTGKPEVLWPEERPLEYLLAERRALGSRLFSREYQNEAIDDDTALFRLEWLEAAAARGTDLATHEIPNVPGLVIVQAWDLSLKMSKKEAEATDSDYTVGVTWAADAAGNRYLLAGTRRRGITPARIRGLVLHEYNAMQHRYLCDVCDHAGILVPGKHRCAECKGDKLAVYGPSAVGVEKNAFGQLHYIGLQKTTDLPLVGHYTGRQKADPYEGVPALAALFEAGKVTLACGDEAAKEFTRILIAELHGFGREAHDDTVLALWIAETVLRRGPQAHALATPERVYDAFGGRTEEPVEDEHEDRDPLWDEIESYCGDPLFDV